MERLSYAWFGFWSEAEKESFKAEKLAKSKPYVNANPVLPQGTSPLFYGSKNWANHILVYCIEEVNHVDRSIKGRRPEVFHFLKELEFYGWYWQAKVLRHHINLAIKKRVFSRRRLSSSSSLTLERSESDHSKSERGGCS